MEPNPRLAGRYAKSILDLALERGQLDSVYNDMLFLQAACRGSKELVSLLRSPIVKSDKKGKIMDAITAGRVSPLTTAFIHLVKDREGHLPEIVTAFIDQYKAYKGIQIVKLTTAVPVDESIRNTLLDKIRGERHPQQIELETQVNEELIGGFVLEIGDEMVDASIAHELNNIRKQFNNNDFIYKIR
jgi:F-type H+-transporting ATPase subunit delta